MPDVSVVIPARDAAATLPGTLAALAAQTLPRGRFEVILADDGSTDATRAIAERASIVDRVVAVPAPPGDIPFSRGSGERGEVVWPGDSPLSCGSGERGEVVWPGDSPLSCGSGERGEVVWPGDSPFRDGAGPGAARNAGAAVATGRVLAFTDADCFPEPDWLERGLAAIERADVVQGAVAPERPPGPFDRTVWVTRPHGLFETANLFVRRDVFVALGGFPRGLTPQSGKELGEDVLFGWTARRSGARVTFAADAKVRHAVFERNARAYVKERERLEAFPALVEAIPELRSALLARRTFLNRRTAAFDLAIAAAIARKPLAAAPYAVLVAQDVKRYGTRTAAARAAADAVGALALARGSIKARSGVL